MRGWEEVLDVYVDVVSRPRGEGEELEERISSKDKKGSVVCICDGGMLGRSASTELTS